MSGVNVLLQKTHVDIFVLPFGARLAIFLRMHNFSDIRQSVADLETRVRALGLSNAAICRLADINPRTFKRWLDGETAPNTDTLVRFQNAVQSAEKIAETIK